MIFHDCALIRVGGTAPVLLGRTAHQATMWESDFMLSQDVGREFCLAFLVLPRSSPFCHPQKYGYKGSAACFAKLDGPLRTPVEKHVQTSNSLVVTRFSSVRCPSCFARLVLYVLLTLAASQKKKDPAKLDSGGHTWLLLCSCPTHPLSEQVAQRCRESQFSKEHTKGGQQKFPPCQEGVVLCSQQ